MTRILLLILAGSFAVACAATDRAPAADAPETDAAGAARTFLAIEGEPPPGRVAEACDAARTLMRAGWDEAADAPRDEDRLVLAAAAYRRAAGSVHCLEATMMTGAAIQRGWLSAVDPHAAARQYFRADALALHQDDPPTVDGKRMTAEILLRQVQSTAKLPDALFAPAATGVSGESEWAARMHNAPLSVRYEAAMRAHFGIDQPQNRELSYQLSRDLPLSADNAPQDWRKAGQLSLITAKRGSDREEGLFRLKVAATKADPIAASFVGRRALRMGNNTDALIYLTVAAMTGEIVREKDLDLARSTLTLEESAAALKLADSILFSAGVIR